MLSAYCPAWPVDPARLLGIDVEPAKLKLNPKVWVTELLWAALLDSCGPDQPLPGIVGGDLNSSETFDYMWSGGPRGIDRFSIECTGLAVARPWGFESPLPHHSFGFASLVMRERDVRRSTIAFGSVFGHESPLPHHSLTAVLKSRQLSCCQGCCQLWRYGAVVDGRQVSSILAQAFAP